MEAIVEILEQELEEAVEVKNKKSLHRYIVLLTENIVRRESYEKEQNEIRSDIKTLVEIIKQGFERVDKRFEDMQKYMDKRFEDMYKYMDKRFEGIDKRFEDMQKYMDKRFEDMHKYTDKRFEDMDKRFSMMFKFISLGFTVLAIIMVVFEFIA
ncbi:MAG TPA: hypothetical protein ENI06_12230 [Spirochaetales bacterium]|nr:hypothetical protein [Spirochaetales bacterium]